MKKILKKKIASFLSVVGLQFLVGTIRFFPRGITYFIGSILSRTYYICAGKNRKIALMNLRSALGNSFSKPELNLIASQSFNTMGHIVLDTVRYKDFSKQQLTESIEVEGIEHLEKALSQGKGVICASAHLGSFTLMGGLLSSMGYKSTFVARHARNKRVEKIMMDFCRQVGQKVIFNRPIVTCMRRCIQTLDRNQLLIIEMDQNFGKEGLKINFFGRPAMVASGPIKLALSTKAAVVPMFIIRKQNNNHIIKIEPQLTMDISGDMQRDIKVNLQNTIDIIEKYIRQYPGQWVNWIHKQWEV
ncbi:MAG: lysophospholipid acyltransferase family protein [Candidatus Omnitrophica bacterium]|nr:lysophospholipid acyltransferase family protein [Candidatus Omnitrophota bacterium]